VDIKAKCKGCGQLYYGCALKYKTELKCPKCGASLEILDAGTELPSGEYRPIPPESQKTIDP